MTQSRSLLLNAGLSVVCGFSGAMLALTFIDRPAMATDKVEIVARKVIADEIVTDKISLVDERAMTVMLPYHIIMQSRTDQTQTSVSPGAIGLRRWDKNAEDLKADRELSLAYSGITQH